MGLPVPDVKFLFALFKKYKIKGKILSLGSQDVYINETELKKLTKKYGFKKIKKSILKSKSAEFNKFRESKNFISPESMFEAIGIKKKNYFDVDKFNFDRPKILHDLQKPITKKIKTKFDFIIDGGTLEHIFDIANVMKNLVKITAVGGRILHIIPCHNYVNHGFYSFSPTFIYDFYILNNFKIEEMYIAEIGLIKKRFFKYNHSDSVDGYYLNRKKRT